MRFASTVWGLEGQRGCIWGQDQRKDQRQVRCKDLDLGQADSQALTMEPLPRDNSSTTSISTNININTNVLSRPQDPVGCPISPGNSNIYSTKLRS